MVVMIKSILTGLFFSFLIGVSAQASDYRVTDAWVRKNLPGQSEAAAFMSVHVAQDAFVVAAGSPVSEFVELRQVRPLPNGRVESVLVGQIPLQAGQLNQLRASGYHLLFRNLKTSSLAAGQQIPIQLKIRTETGQVFDLQAQAIVRGLSGY